MTNTEEILSNLKVVKRNNRKLVDFDKAKIALAIKKGFDSIVGIVRHDLPLSLVEKFCLTCNVSPYVGTIHLS